MCAQLLLGRRVQCLVASLKNVIITICLDVSCFENVYFRASLLLITFITLREKFRGYSLEAQHRENYVYVFMSHHQNT
jgi:hypothetical protein